MDNALFTFGVTFWSHCINTKDGFHVCNNSATIGGSNYDAAGLWLGLRNQINYAVCIAIGVPPATAARGVQTFDTSDCQPIYSRFRLIIVREVAFSRTT